MQLNASAYKKKPPADRLGETCRTLTLSDGLDSHGAASPRAHPPQQPQHARATSFGAQRASPPRLFQMPLKTEVITLVRGAPRGGAIGREPTAPEEVKEELSSGIVSQTKPGSRAENGRSTSPVDTLPRQALRQTKFEVPIARKKRVPQQT